MSRRKHQPLGSALSAPMQPAHLLFQVNRLATERAILCGAVSDTRLPVADTRPLQRRLWGRDRNVYLTIEDVRRALWLGWLTYILDQFLNSHRPPDTTRDEWLKAELAFGCILFTDETFRVLQVSVDHAGCLVDIPPTRESLR